MALPLDQLDLLGMPADLLAGAPLQLPIDAIEEDPDQPRQEFDAEGLAELAETIKERGVRQPISVRRHPEKPDRWMLNFGARRLRASRLVGKLDIPAFVDNTADSYDQVIENEQREGLKPLELALFVQRRLAAGENQADIGKRLGKSRTFITMVCAMIEPPDWLMAAYRSGQCRGITELYELRRLHGLRPDDVQTLLTAGAPVTRAALAAIKDASATDAQLLVQTVTIMATAEPHAPARSNGARASAGTTAGVDATPTSLLAEANRLCDAIVSIIEQMRASESTGIDADLDTLRARLAALATR